MMFTCPLAPGKGAWARRRCIGAVIVIMSHEAQWVEVAPEEGEQVRHLIRKMMTTAGTLDVPLQVDCIRGSAMFSVHKQLCDPVFSV